MDRLEAMQVFVEAIEGGSLSAAGRKLGMPLATVSRKLSDLEAHLKSRLLNRSTRQLTLTDAGREYLGACKRILEDVGEAERGAAGEYSEPRGDLVITAPIVFGRVHVLPVILEFLAAYPEVDVRLVQSDRVLHLLDEQVDLAIRIGPLPDSRLTATRLGGTRRVVCASPDYLRRAPPVTTPPDLTRHACIAFDAMTSQDSWRFPSAQGEISVPIQPRLQVNSADAALTAALAGSGLTRLLCYQIRAAEDGGRLQRVLNEYEPEPSPISLVYTQQRRLPLKQRAFLDFAAPRLRERLSLPSTEPTIAEAKAPANHTRTRKRR